MTLTTSSLMEKAGLCERSSSSLLAKNEKEARGSRRMNAFECVELSDSVKTKEVEINEKHKARKLNRDDERNRMMTSDACVYAGGSVESLDWLDVTTDDTNDGNTTNAFLAVEARNDSKNSRVKIKDAFTRKGEIGVVQVYRCSYSNASNDLSPPSSPSSSSKIRLEYLIEHDGGFAHCVRWLPNLPMKKVKKMKKEKKNSSSSVSSRKKMNTDDDDCRVDEVEVKVEYEIEASRSVLDAKLNELNMKDIKDASKDILGYLAACLADGSVQVWAVPNVKKKENIVTELKAENMCIFKGELVTKNPMRGGLSLSWSQGAPGRLAVGTVDGSVCVFDIHRCMQYDIENKVKYTNSSNSNATSFAHVPTLTVAMEEIGPIRDIEFAPLEDNDENKEDEKSIEDDIKRKRIASTNFIAVAANKVSKANVIDLRSRSVLPESFQIEKWYDDILCVAWLPKGAYMYGCDSTISFNGRNFRYLLRQCDGPICWEEDEKEGKYVGIVGFPLPAADDILKQIKNAASKDAINHTKRAGGTTWSIDSRILGTRGSRNNCSFVVVGSNSGVVSASVQRYRIKECKRKDALWKSQGSWSAFEQIGGMREVRVGKERCVEFRTPGEEDIIRKKEGGDVSDDDDDDDDEGFRIRKGLECHEVRVNRTGNMVWIASGFVNGFVRVQSVDKSYLDEICDTQSDEMDKWLYK